MSLPTISFAHGRSHRLASLGGTCPDLAAEHYGTLLHVAHCPLPIPLPFPSIFGNQVGKQARLIDERPTD
jgi:hypothetical protein